jgi:hypothetical protein
MKNNKKVVSIIIKSPNETTINFGFGGSNQKVIKLIQKKTKISQFKCTTHFSNFQVKYHNTDLLVDMNNFHADPSLLDTPSVFDMCYIGMSEKEIENEKMKKELELELKNKPLKLVQMAKEMEANYQNEKKKFLKKDYKKKIETSKGTENDHYDWFVKYTLDLENGSFSKRYCMGMTYCEDFYSGAEYDDLHETFGLPLQKFTFKDEKTLILLDENEITFPLTIDEICNNDSSGECMWSDIYGKIQNYFLSWINYPMLYKVIE